MKKFLESFKYAFNGIKLLLKERNFKIDAIIGIIVLIFSYIFQITKLELLVILICIAMQLCLEAINTVMEYICDLYTKEKNKKIKRVKDMSAGFCLINAFIVSIIGLIIFIPYL